MDDRLSLERDFLLTIPPSKYDLKEFSKDTPMPNQDLSEAVVDSSNDENNLIIHYVTDIHLEQKIVDHFGRSSVTKREIQDFVSRYVRNAFEKYYSADGIFLFGGDVANNISLVRLFFEEAIKYINQEKTIAILGNHELWNTPHGGLDKSVEQYRRMFYELDITLAQNDLVLLVDDELRYVPEEDLQNMPDEELKETCLKSPLILLGGLGFSGYNKSFNASDGLYCSALVTVEEDLEQTNRFRKLYEKVRRCLSGDRVIVFTHTPVDNWYGKEDYEPNWIYVNGHTHSNRLVANDRIRVYSDNQIGYRGNHLGFHCFMISGEYDIFRHLSDGVYRISGKQYRDFYNSRGSPIQYNGDGKLYALKRSGVYCFVSERKGRLRLMDGGSPISTDLSIGYIYANLGQYFQMMIDGYKPFRDRLELISEFVRSFGGTGFVHGCIVDIDFYNHIFLDPFDGRITPYYATDKCNKYVFKTIGGLIKNEVPYLYPKYLEISATGKNLPAVVQDSDVTPEIDVPVLVGGTSVYRLSKTVRGFQYMSDMKIVRQWNDSIYRKYAGKNLPPAVHQEITDIPSDDAEEDDAEKVENNIEENERARDEDDSSSSEILTEYVRKAIDATITQNPRENSGNKSNGPEGSTTAQAEKENDVSAGDSDETMENVSGVDQNGVLAVSAGEFQAEEKAEGEKNSLELEQHQGFFSRTISKLRSLLFSKPKK